MKEFLYQAYASDLGIAVETDNVQLCVQRLHKAKRELNDPDLDCLTIAVSREHPNTEVLIVKQGVPDGGEE